LRLPNKDALKTALQKGLYDVLKAYEHRVFIPYVFSVVFVWYSKKQIKTMRSYFARFNYALELIKNETESIEVSPHRELQWALIESCLKGQLDMMAEEMTYSREVTALSVKMSKARIQSIPLPMRLVADNELDIAESLIESDVVIKRLETLVSELTGDKTKLVTQVTNQELVIEELSDLNINKEASIERLEKEKRSLLDLNLEQHKAIVKFTQMMQDFQRERPRSPTQGAGFFDLALAPAAGSANQPSGQNLAP
jgi:hypothetical protein